jgi:hypothetical protein
MIRICTSKWLALCMAIIVLNSNPATAAPRLLRHPSRVPYVSSKLVEPLPGQIKKPSEQRMADGKVLHLHDEVSEARAAADQAEKQRAAIKAGWFETLFATKPSRPSPDTDFDPHVGCMSRVLFGRTETAVKTRHTRQLTVCMCRRRR